MSRRLSWLPLAFAILLLAAPRPAPADPAAQAAPAAQARAESSRLTFDLVFADDASGHQAHALSWSPDGRQLAYLWNDGHGEALWVLDPETSERSAWVRPGEGGAPADLELGDFRWSPTGDALLFLSGGDLYLFTAHGKPASRWRRLTETAAAEKDPKISPDGTQLAFVRDDDLFVMDLATGREQALTEDGAENLVINGTTDWVYGEEIWSRNPTGFWWSPDGRRIAFYRFDEEPVQRYPLVNFLPLYPQVEWQRYPKAGTANPLVRIGVVDVLNGATVWMKTGDDPTAYLARVDWLDGGARLAIQRLNRDQTRLDVLRCNPDGGDCDPFLTEEAKTWVNLSDAYRFLPDGRLLWSSERSGWRQLYLYDKGGRELRQLTEGDRPVTSLDGVDTPAGWVVYSTFAPGFLGGAERQVLRVPLDGGEPQVLADRKGWNSAVVAPKTGYWVHTWSDADHTPELSVRKPDAHPATDLPWSPPSGYDPAQLPSWEVFTIPGPNGLQLPARLLKPEGFDPNRRYPVIMYHYGCPASQVVTDSWDRRSRDLWHKMMAQRGYAVLQVDNGGSIFFGKRGEEHAYRRFGPGNLAAQLAGVRYLERLPWVDPSRIGLWGWSGGGSNTLYALLNSPGTWKAGVSGAPVTDWHLYDTIWTERYLDRPQDNEEGYEKSSPVTYAANLADKLLIVHGTADDNVHPQNTIVMSNALIQAGKPFEQAIYPRQKHGFKEPSYRHFFERMTAFFDRILGGGD